MRMLLSIRFPLEPFNSLVREGVIGERLPAAVAAIQPEAIYFTEQDGQRGAMAIVDVADASAVPSLAEPFFLGFNATCEFRIAMTVEDLESAGLDSLGQRWT